MFTYYVLVVISLATGKTAELKPAPQFPQVRFSSSWQCARAKDELEQYFLVMAESEDELKDLMQKHMFGCKAVRVKLQKGVDAF